MPLASGVRLRCGGHIISNSIKLSFD
jgi:hypothetical protein